MTSTNSGPGERVRLPPTSATQVAGRQVEQTVQQAIHVVDRQVAGQGQRQQRHTGYRAHGCEVAEVDGERFVADRGHRAEAAVEVHALDHRVGGYDVERPAHWLDHGGVVPDAHGDPRRRGRHPGSDSIEQPVFAEVTDRLGSRRDRGVRVRHG